MRNWNEKENTELRKKLACFYATYEELKPATNWSNRTTLTCFYATYEELKHNTEASGGASLTRFYATYEELKPAYSGILRRNR